MVRLAIILSLAGMGISADTAPIYGPPHAMVGPTVICFLDGQFEVERWERVTVVMLGLDSGALQIDGPHGRYYLGEGHVLEKPPAELGSKVYATQSTSIHKSASGRGIQYAVVSPQTPQETQPVKLWLYGRGLTGGKADARLYKRIRLDEPKPGECPWIFDRGALVSDSYLRSLDPASLGAAE